jgi:hypothetical protein
MCHRPGVLGDLDRLRHSATTTSCGAAQTVKTSVGAQIGVVASSAELQEGETESLECSTVNPGYSGDIILSCHVTISAWGGVLKANTTTCQCNNPYDIGSDSYFCHKYMYCYQAHGQIGNPGQCAFDCTGVPGWEEANIPWGNTAVEAQGYEVGLQTRETHCDRSPNPTQDAGEFSFGPEDLDYSRTFLTDGECGDVSTNVVTHYEAHGGHVATTTWEQLPSEEGVILSGGHCLPAEVVDFDECAFEAGHSHDCHRNAECINTLGSYRCECRPAWEGDGVSCADRAGCRDGRCFSVHTTVATFDVAEAYCQGLHPTTQSTQGMPGHLASVHSGVEQDFIFGLLGETGDYWLGLGQDAENEPWWWTDGSALDFVKWLAPDPDNLPDQECGLTRYDPSNSKHSMWFDLGCDTTHNFVCQWHP